MFVYQMHPELNPANWKPVIHPHGGCRTCHFWGAWTSTRPLPNGYYVVTLIGATALCLRTKHTDVQSVKGCEHWQRETGADDHL